MQNHISIELKLNPFSQRCNLQIIIPIDFSLNPSEWNERTDE